MRVSIYKKRLVTFDFFFFFFGVFFFHMLQALKHPSLQPIIFQYQ